MMMMIIIIIIIIMNMDMNGDKWHSYTVVFI